MIKESIIKKHINFDNDLTKSNDFISKQIINSKLIIIGGAGTIGSSYIKQIIKNKPNKIVKDDINENG